MLKFLISILVVCFALPSLAEGHEHESTISFENADDASLDAPPSSADRPAPKPAQRVLKGCKPDALYDIRCLENGVPYSPTPDERIKYFAERVEKESKSGKPLSEETKEREQKILDRAIALKTAEGINPETKILIEKAKETEKKLADIPVVEKKKPDEANSAGLSGDQGNGKSPGSGGGGGTDSLLGKAHEEAYNVPPTVSFESIAPSDVAALPPPKGELPKVGSSPIHPNEEANPISQDKALQPDASTLINNLLAETPVPIKPEAPKELDKAKSNSKGSFIGGFFGGMIDTLAAPVGVLGGALQSALGIGAKPAQAEASNSNWADLSPKLAAMRDSTTPAADKNTKPVEDSINKTIDDSAAPPDTEKKTEANTDLKESNNSSTDKPPTDKPNTPVPTPEKQADNQATPVANQPNPGATGKSPNSASTSTNSTGSITNATPSTGPSPLAKIPSPALSSLPPLANDAGSVSSALQNADPSLDKEEANLLPGMMTASDPHAKGANSNQNTANSAALASSADWGSANYAGTTLGLLQSLDPDFFKTRPSDPHPATPKQKSDKTASDREEEIPSGENRLAALDPKPLDGSVSSLRKLLQKGSDYLQKGVDRVANWFGMNPVSYSWRNGGSQIPEGMPLYNPNTGNTFGSSTISNTSSPSSSGSSETVAINTPSSRLAKTGEQDYRTTLGTMYQDLGLTAGYIYPVVPQADNLTDALNEALETLQVGTDRELAAVEKPQVMEVLEAGISSGVEDISSLVKELKGWSEEKVSDLQDFMGLSTKKKLKPKNALGAIDPKTGKPIVSGETLKTPRNASNQKENGLLKWLRNFFGVG